MAKNKYYAVKAGLTPGIYTTWAECEANVKGFSGATYKGFGTLIEAEQFLGNCDPAYYDEPSSTKQLIFHQSNLVAYTDGSYDAITNRYSHGVVMYLNDTVIQELSGVADKYPASNNVSGEIDGAIRAINWAVDNGYPEILIKHDYSGVAHWATGTWRAKLPLTRSYVQFIQQASKHIKINFEHVKGHSGDPGNERADQQAKEALGI